MNIHVMTLFPEMFESLKLSILGRAIKNNIINIEAVNIRDYAFNKHNSVDDYTYGGGAGMLMQAEPVYQCHNAIVNSISKGDDVDTKNDLSDQNNYDDQEDNSHVDSRKTDSQSRTDIKRVRTIYMTPQGTVLTQELAQELAKEEELILLCGHYEGIDERVLEETVTDYISIGDYVLTGGELPAMVLIDTVSRFVEGVLSNDESAMTESFSNGLLEYPQYSRPEVWHDKKVPDVLMSGHHLNVEKWRFEQSLKRTEERRPDLYEQFVATHKKDKKGRWIM